MPSTYFADRVYETSTSTGTGSFTLAGAATGYQTFSSAFGTNTAYYVITNQTVPSEWEVGSFTVSGATLARVAGNVLSGSAGAGTLVNFSAGTKNVYNIAPAAAMAAWNVGSSTPAGVVSPFAGSTEPTGWLLCYGQAISRTTYATLFTAIGTTYGAGDGSTTFNLPDLRGRTVAGKDNMGGTAASRITAGGSGITGTTLGAAGGTETHTLTAAQSGLPSHSHTTTLLTQTSPGGTFSTIGTNADGYANTNFGSSTAGGTSASSAHQNTQPTMMLNYIIKT